MTKEELLIKVYQKAYSTTHQVPMREYYRLPKPKPMTMDDGRVINVEWVQPSYWGLDVLINYRTDGIFAKKLSENELKELLEII